MCRRMVILANEGQHRFVGQCEHGAIHLYWDMIQVQLTPAAFTTMFGSLQVWALRGMRNEYRDEWVCYRMNGNRVQIWIGSECMLMTREQFNSFCVMLSHVQHRHSAVSPAVAAGCEAAPDAQTLWAS